MEVNEDLSKTVKEKWKGVNYNILRNGFWRPKLKGANLNVKHEA